MSKTIILIPSRLDAKRLPNKPLLKIKGKSIISHVYQKAVKASIGDVYVATGDLEIYKDIINNKGKCILTKKNHKSGTDRIYEALRKLNYSQYNYIINLQGDEPNININDLKNLKKKIISKNYSMGTLASDKFKKKNLENINIVKVQTEKKLTLGNLSKALKFYRHETKKNINTYHHIGIYIYKKEILKKIVSLKQTKNEIKFKLEQLRALDNKIKIYVSLSKSIPIGIDTYEDYIKLKKLFEKINY